MSIAAKCTCGRRAYYCSGSDCPKMIRQTIKPIYGTTESGTETILDKWLSGSKDVAAKFLVMCISVNAPKTPNNTEEMAKETIEKWIYDNYEN